MFHQRPDDEVDMVWHDDVAAQNIALAIEMAQGILDHVSHIGIFQPARTVSVIQLRLHLFAEFFHDGFGGCTGGAHRRFAFLLPSDVNFVRQRISQPECYEIGCPVLPPMRQVPAFNARRTGFVEGRERQWDGL